ncbi:low molecular weight protein-tyrosine-phosphatase [Nocardioides caeni]|uniref:protein-tyrosine-phosphatase n=1 Tax=Nocardioides caeni TaxID=574700 RepID=A0A4S8N0P9_9ACTN|nr:low molecular weight protein-tyrosine-phosphatase [Nocardioides caeni]THV09333.1 low molecular weight phosphotyrosine protein phosphatase [Nocardioides caeni]
MTEAPPPLEAGRYRVALICLGNICRSPTADVVLTDRLAAAGLGEVVEVVSAGTGDWHVGEAMDRRSAALLTREGYDPTRHRAQQVRTDWLANVDLLLEMDRQNLADLQALGPATPERLRLFRDFDPEGTGEDVPDPWHGGESGFVDVLTMVERTADQLVERLRSVVGT